MKWMRFKWLYFLISAIFILPGIFSLIKYGFRPSIDFAGGGLLELRFDNKFSTNDFSKIIGSLAEKKIFLSSVQATSDDTLLLKSKTLNQDERNEVEAVLEKNFGPNKEIRYEVVGPTLGRELLVKTIVAILLAAGFITFYVAWRFRNVKFGVCAILAMFHDTFVLLGSFSILGHFFGVEIDTLFVTAVLTILSFSVHDTVVVYDRIRETSRAMSKASFEDIANMAVTETLSRSLNNSLTIIFMLVALLLLGGETVRWFVAALLVGTITGTYSSTFTATPLLVVWDGLVRKKS